MNQDFLKPKTYYYHIEGINCHACAYVISMALEEAGFDGLEVDLAKHELIVPAESNGSISKIKEVIDQSGHYILNLN